MNTHQVAAEFAALCKAGQHEQAGERFWADDIVSREAMEGDMAMLKGRAAVKGKGEWWYANHEIHSAETQGPYVNGDQFMLRFIMDITVKASGQRMQMDEMGLYTVRDGKVTEERFFYAAP
jgi:ketosteroid isomerase-like protein